MQCFWGVGTAGKFAIGAGGSLSANATVSVNGSGKLDILDGLSLSVFELYFDGVKQARGTWGKTGSGADNIDDTHFTGGTGILAVGPAVPVITAFTIADRTSGSTLVTNEASVTVSITAEPADSPIHAYLVTDTDEQPTGGWLPATPILHIITASTGTVTLYAWAKDEAGGIGRPPLHLPPIPAIIWAG